MKKYLIFLIVGIGLFLAPHFSYASTILYSQTSIGSSTPVVPASGGNFSLSPSYIVSSSTTPNIIYAYIQTDATSSDSCPSYPGYGDVLYVNGTSNEKFLLNCNDVGIFSNYAWGEFDYLSGPQYDINTIVSSSVFFGGQAFNGEAGNIATNLSGISTLFITDATTTPPCASNCSSTISFVFPTNGTSTGIFNPWLLSASNLNASDTYITKVMWQACPVGQVQNSANCTQTIFNHSEPQTGADIALHGITVQRVEWPFDFGSNQTVYASAELQDNGFVAVDSINFTLLSIPNSSPSSTLSTGGIYIIASSTGNGTYVTTSTSGFTAINALGTSTVSAFCPPPGDPTGYIGYGLCQAVNFAFNPNIFPQSVSYFGNQISAIEAVPPFSGFFAFFNDASSSLNTGYQNSSSTSVSIGILGFNSNGSMPQVNLVTLNSTTFNNGMGGSTHASSTAEATGFLETYIGAFLWIAAGIRILHLFAVS